MLTTRMKPPCRRIGYHYKWRIEMSNSHIIQKSRERLRLSVDEAAAAVGVSVGHFRDLEGFDNEFTTTLSLAQFGRLCRLLHLPPHLLLEHAPPQRAISPIQLRDDVLETCRQRKWSLAQFSQRVGWAMQPLIEDPADAVASWNLHCLQAVCAELQIDYVEAIPPE